MRGQGGQGSRGASGAEERSGAILATSYSLHPTPYTLHPTPHTPFFTDNCLAFLPLPADGGLSGVMFR
ncbi:hypothetical protein [Chroococcidiopsis sp.]|uniref:hypothetical protein n=1 Tax=Chroococcidiopsis sp. TaxID=3088168 RepID=UPI003F3DFA2D